MVKTKSLKKEDGSLTVEFALLVPVIIVFIAIIGTFSSWAILALKVNSAVGEISREAIVIEDIRTPDSKTRFDKILQNHLSQKEKENASLEVYYVDEFKNNLDVDNDMMTQKYVFVKLTENVKSGPLAIAIDKIENEIIAKVEQ